jgi:hypothetical protein
MTGHYGTLQRITEQFCGASPSAQSGLPYAGGSSGGTMSVTLPNPLTIEMGQSVLPANAAKVAS